jgi:hypothetical protein
MKGRIHFARIATPPLLHEDRMNKSAYALCAALLVFAGAASNAHAQVISNGEIERGLRFSGPTHDGEPYTQRYSYGLGQGILYFNGDSRNLWYLDYLDRADRARKFGYAMPVDPYFPDATPEPTQPVVRRSFGIFRRR